jgi:thioredoxin 1
MNLKTVLSSNKYVLIDFYSEDCPACKWIESELIKVKAYFEKDLEIYQVDQVKQKEVFSAFKVKSLPHLKLFRSGRPMWSNSGLISGEGIIEQIKKWK